jgi:hypothetical protein
MIVPETIEGEIVEKGSQLATRPATGTAVANWTPSFAVSVDEAVAQVEAKHDFFKRVMREGDHYGVIPGTSTKPALLKPGAELLLSNMGLQKVLVDADAPTIDYGEDGREGLIRYRRICQIYRQIGPAPEDRMLVAQAEGSCSSREVKYRWRTSGASCPQCGNALRMSKDKPEWYCWRKKGGCGETYPAAQFSFEKIANPDLADLENTILKMADKRALVAATLLATGCSDIFTQDIEDSAPPADEADPEPQRPANAPRGEAPANTRTGAVRDALANRPKRVALPELLALALKLKIRDTEFAAWAATNVAPTLMQRERVVLTVEESIEAKRQLENLITMVEEEALAQPAAAPAGTKMTPGTQGYLFRRLDEEGLSAKDDRIAWAKENGVDVDSFSKLTEDQGKRLIDALDGDLFNYAETQLASERR